ncbi:hypothetical protein BGX30_006026 [Mortierella sp. GBA39]|nr:hypothetical protein BGX30_006026 [Mortierella sp. GBA39]
MDLENKGVYVDGQETDARSPVSASNIIDRTLLSRKNIKYLYIAIMTQAFLRSFEVNLMYTSLNVISAILESASFAAILPIILEIISAALVPFYTKISDVVGRSQAMTIAALMYLLGYTVQGTSYGFLQLALGQIFYGVGSTGLMTLAQVLIADITPLIDRGIMFALWGMPTTVNVFIVSLLVDPLTHPGANWRNVYAIIGTIALIGFIILLGPLWHYQRKAERLAASHGRRTETRSIRWLFSEFDAVGALLITMALGLTLLPIILARSYEDNWKSPKILGMFFSGVLSWVLLVLLTGFAMKRFKVCRPFIWIGIFIQTIGLGLQIPARKPSSSDAFIVIAQIIAGGGAGMANNAAIVAVTGSVSKDDTATAIGVIHILGSYLPMRLAKHITGPYNERLAMNDPLKYIPNLDLITKGQLVEAYADSQMLMLIIAMCLAIPVCITTLFMRNIDLMQDQNDVTVEGEGEEYAIDGVASDKHEVK